MCWYSGFKRHSFPAPARKRLSLNDWLLDIPREELSWEIMSHRGVWGSSLWCAIGMTLRQGLGRAVTCVCCQEPLLTFRCDEKCCYLFFFFFSSCSSEASLALSFLSISSDLWIGLSNLEIVWFCHMLLSEIGRVLLRSFFLYWLKCRLLLNRESLDCRRWREKSEIKPSLRAKLLCDFKTE